MLCIKISGNKLRIAVARALERLDRFLLGCRRIIKPAAVAAFDDVTCYWLSRALYLAAESGLLEALGEKPRPLNSISTELGCSEEALRRLVGVLGGHGYFRFNRRGELCHTRLSRALKSQGHDFLNLVGSDWYLSSFSRQAEAFRSGRPGFELSHGEALFEHLSKQNQKRVLFDRAMSNISQFVGPAIVESFPFCDYDSVLDVGGGDGSLLSVISQRCPHIRLAVLEMHADFGGPWEVHEGDFFGEIPSGYALIILKNILHDWPDPKAAEILKGCRKTGAELAICECLMPEDLTPSPVRLLDYNVWMTLGGQERTETHFRELLKGQGFELVRVHPTFTPFSVLHARPVEVL